METVKSLEELIKEAIEHLNSPQIVVPKGTDIQTELANSYSTTAVEVTADALNVHVLSEDQEKDERYSWQLYNGPFLSVVERAKMDMLNQYNTKAQEEYFRMCRLKKEILPELKLKGYAECLFAETLFEIGYIASLCKEKQ